MVDLLSYCKNNTITAIIHYPLLIPWRKFLKFKAVAINIKNRLEYI